MLQQYALLGDMADDEYAKYQDDYNRWLQERSFAQAAADDEYNKALQKYANMISIFDNNRAYDLQQQQLAYQRERDAVADDQWAQEFALAQQKAYGGGNPTNDPTKNQQSSYHAANRKATAYAKAGYTQDMVWAYLRPYINNGISTTEANKIMSNLF